MTVLKTSLRNFLAHKGRMALSAVAVLLSVAFVSGTLVFTDTMNTTFDKLFAVTATDVTVAPQEKDGEDEDPQSGRTETLPASALEKVRKVEGVQVAEGSVSVMNATVVDGRNKDVGPTGGAPTIVGNWTENDLRAMEISEGRSPRGPTEVMVDEQTADKRKLAIGDELRVISAFGDHRAKISGLLSFKVTNPGAALFYFDTPTAQRQLLGQAGLFNYLHITGVDGLADETLKKRVDAALGGEFKLTTAKETADQGREEVGEMLNVMRYAMLGFAGIAFLVGIFLIVNTFSMLVAQRTREIGLMRAIGSSRQQVNRSVLIESLFLGIVGSVLGVAAGVGLAVGLMQLMGAVGMELSTDDLTVKWTTPVVGVLLGVVVTVLAAYVPARRAGKVSPMAALRDAGTPADGRAGWIRALIGLALTGTGTAALIVVTQAEKASEGSLFLGVGIFLTLLGFVVIGPLLAGVVVKALGTVVLRAFGPVGRMAERNALRNPRRTGATGAALMIGLALVACLSVVGSSMVASATEELDRSVGADYIVQSSNGQPVVPQARTALEQVGGLERITDYRLVMARITAPDGKTAKEELVVADPAYAKDLRRDMAEGEQADAYRKNAISVGSEYAEKHGVRIGDTLTVDFTAGKTAELKVTAITSDDNAMDQGAKYLSTETAREYIPAADFPLSYMVLATAADGQEKQARAALESALADYPQYKVRDQTDYKNELKSEIDSLLNIIYGLLGLAIVVAVLGVVNTLALSVVERTREIGLLRAIGLSRRQLRRMIRLESVVIALFGALLGLGLGMGWGAAAQKLLALEGMKILEIPWTTIILVFLASALVGLFAALVPAFRAGRMNVLNAIATDG
ncbi:ABC transporter permease [Streptomyces yaizuensis]|uniref:ABC transporter permease n=1 Tax=Streptomyces yaizuensis TaxID=2989713 RepID=A0ABQ5P9T0_9ACTN|nr:FtsX-like permease family protein [Streptomyces sp. YSPA8]GLF99349.1 ABC transporter permease [Streptomyces sp. YSPA8]